MKNKKKINTCKNSEKLLQKLRIDLKTTLNVSQLLYSLYFFISQVGGLVNYLNGVHMCLCVCICARTNVWVSFKTLSLSMLESKYKPSFYIFHCCLDDTPGIEELSCCWHFWIKFEWIFLYSVFLTQVFSFTNGRAQLARFAGFNRSIWQ